MQRVVKRCHLLQARLKKMILPSKGHIFLALHFDWFIKVVSHFHQCLIKPYTQYANLIISKLKTYDIFYLFKCADQPTTSIST